MVQLRSGRRSHETHAVITSLIKREEDATNRAFRYRSEVNRLKKDVKKKSQEIKRLRKLLKDKDEKKKGFWSFLFGLW